MENIREEAGLMDLKKLNDLLCMYAAAYFVLGIMIISIFDMIAI